MDRMELIETFAAVARAEGFSAAARDLGQPLATVSRKVAALEQELGVQLLLRTTRRVRLTEDGARYLKIVPPLLAALREAEADVAQANRALSGELVLSSPVPFGERHLVPVIAAFRDAHPGITVRHLMSNRRIDYVAEGVDLGLRIGPLADSAARLVALGEVRVVLCATPAYLERFGVPEQPEDLAAHRVVAFSHFGKRVRWRFAGPDGMQQMLDVDPVYSVDSVDAIQRFVLADGGIGRFYSYQVADYVADGRLRVLLPRAEVAPEPVSFLYPDKRFLPRRARAFLDFAGAQRRGRLVSLSEMIAD